MNHAFPGDAAARAAAIADEVLFPAAAEVEASGEIPKSHFDLLAAEGFYGLAGPVEYGGLGLPMDQACLIIEHLAGGCLSTAFVWLQHHSTVLSLTYGNNAPMRERWLAELCSGRVRSGIALDGVRQGASAVHATATGDGYVLDGETDWVTGWGMLDLLRVAARDEHGNIVYCLVDPVESASLRTAELSLIAGSASRTVRLTFVGHPVPADRVQGVHPPAPTETIDARALRVNASLRLGVAARCSRMLSTLTDEVAALRSQLDSADETGMSAACAAASELAMRAASALVVATGSKSVLPDSPAGRLAREALFLLVFASRPSIKAALLTQLTQVR